MNRILLLVLLIVLSASPAAAQSCATLGSPAGCDTLPKRSATSPAAPPAEQKTQMHGSSEVTVSNHGTSTTLDNTVIDSHGMVEFGFRGSTRAPCRVPGYGSACE